MLKFRTSIFALAAISAASIGAAVPAAATEGYSAIGFGAREKALAGAGVADSRDATAASLNPAGLVHVGDEITMSVSAFSPRRSFSTDGPGLLIDQVNIDSDKNWFFIPNLAWSTRKLANPLFDVMAFTMVGNGGMNTSYPTFTNNNLGFCPPGSQGVFCSGKAGINLLQMVMSVAFAKQIAPGISVGVAPMMALQSFDAHGTDLFAGASITGNVSGNRNDWSVGGGVRAGVEIEPMKGFRIGVAGTSPIWMQDFEKYDGFFAERGGFDIPASLHAGVAVDINPALTLMFDWRYIWYSSVDSVGNPMANLGGCTFGAPTEPGCLGGSRGAGFGWDDINILKFGVEYRANDKLTLRAGYAWNEQPINKADVSFNILAPAVTQHHITGGLEYNLGNGYHLELAGMYAPTGKVTGPEFFNAGAQAQGAPLPDQNVTLEMYQYEFTVGIKYKFDEVAAPLK
ncbi:MAG: outer membrane protein transport protein [Hyphomicrobiaceae bacterium]|nr:outer membrane protein transport protein [Hyphomicrobiaceae bacterium]